MVKKKGRGSRVIVAAPVTFDERRLLRQIAARHERGIAAELRLIIRAHIEANYECEEAVE